MKFEIPEKKKIIKTSSEDSGPERYCSNNYFIRKIYLDRLDYALSFIKPHKYDSILEIGFGNGMLYPTLSKATRFYKGIDIHNSIEKIAAIYGDHFLFGNIYDIPFNKIKFDCVICLSVLEHLDDLKKALSEIDRVSASTSHFIFGIPSDNIFVKLWFWFKKSPALKSHINSKKRLLDLISSYYTVMQKKTLRFLFIDLYTVIYCRKKLSNN